MSAPAEPRWDYRLWLRRAAKWLAAVAAIVLLVYLASAFLPRWWSHRVADQVGGGFTLGIVLGLFYGFVFTLLPLVVLRWAFGRRRPLKLWTALAVAAVVLATPNLLTLAIVIGTGNAAHAGERTLDVDAPGFRNASLAGALIALAVVVAGQYLLLSRRRARHQVAELRRS